MKNTLISAWGRKIIPLPIIVFLLVNFAFRSVGGDLDAPAKKEVTIASEISRGCSGIRAAAARPLYFLDMASAMTDFLQRDKQNNTDTEAFLLGANLGIWLACDVYAHDGDSLAIEFRRRGFQEMRRLQRKLEISDEALCSVAGAKPETVIPEIRDYEKRLDPKPSATP